ncbi:hypothetical protein KC325_g259 [Hortaea werneckii]|nr:hypothetical protein KC325_g259 [Hortaea werneckii]
MLAISSFGASGGPRPGVGKLPVGGSWRSCFSRHCWIAGSTRDDVNVVDWRRARGADRSKEAIARCACLCRRVVLPLLRNSDTTVARMELVQIGLGQGR